MQGFKEKIKNLSVLGKIHMLSALLLAVSAILPWYKETDVYSNSFFFLGVTGPTYLFGLLVLILGAASILFTFRKINGLVSRRTNSNFVTIQMGLGIFAITLCVLSASVLFHKDFGINIVGKTAGIGLWLALISSVVMTAVTYLNKGASEVVSTNINHDDLEAFIDISDRMQNTGMRERSLDELSKLHDRLYNRD